MAKQQVIESNEALKRQLEYVSLCKKIVEDRAKSKGSPLKACVNTFGCQMNARDSEKLLGILKSIGYVETEDEKDADFVLYNTCTVRENANLRVYGRLGQLSLIKKKNPDMIVALCGCMMQEEEVVEKIRKSYRFVDLIFGTFNVFKLAELLYNRFTSESQIVDIWKESAEVIENLPTERKYKFKSGVNIMYGCDNFCTYCIVPYVRGREKSREPEEIICEIKRLVSDGVKEVMLLGQNVNSYGNTLARDYGFANLLEDIEQIEGLERIRFMTPHPKDFKDDVLEVIAKSKKICRHLHLPMQSGSSAILKKMNRHYTKEDYISLVEKIRKVLPDVSLTTDIIVGFPGESEEDFLDTLDVVRKCRFDSAFTFIYSKRSGTPAAKMDDQIDETVVKDRFNRLLDTVNEVSHTIASRFTGEVVECLVESLNDHDDSLVTGRMANNILVHFKGDESLIGEFVNVSLDECKGFYYMGHIVE